MSELRLAKLIEVSDITGYYTAIIIVQSLSHVRPSVTPWTEACQASLSFTISWSLFRFLFIQSVMLAIIIIFTFCICVYLLTSWLVDFYFKDLDNLKFGL